ncbi:MULTISPECIES: CHASE3 domain-containing protein [Methylobacterium]|uniref:histidine kinase n=1 Tax=Methylobacterium nonmethylotrophicum TaxID=1141884 RepID=A0A4Z0NSY0_9HYPH|nr:MULTISPECIES: CHASE3 domain-containing protein [Methylobacterium]MCF4124994.1 CHASE3 domain-containing protein [Methylobacterium sp. SyP6R]TGD99717.1 response regulator [Methylobacterium nonmethylotrophicum]
MTQYLVRRANVLVLGVLIAILALVGAATWERLNASRDARTWSRHSYQVLDTTKDLAIALRDAERGQRGYVLTGRAEYLGPYDVARDRLGLLQGELQKLTADNPAQQERIRALAPAIQHKLEELAQTLQARRDGGLEAALRIINGDAGRNHMREAETILATMLADEQRLLDERLVQNDARATWVRWMVIAGSVLAVLTLLWAARLLNQAWSRSYRTETEQRAVALRLRTTLDSLSQGVAVFGPDRKLANWNECFQVLLDLPKAMVRRGTTYGAFVEHTGEPGRPALETEDQVRHGSRNPREAVTYERENAEGHHLEIRRTPMPDGGFVLTISDMTKRAQAEGVLREAQKMQAIGQLTGGIAHDFNNLLQVILGNLEFIRAKLDGDARLQTRIERASWAAQRGATLTGQLLAFARKQPLAPSAIDLAATMPDLIPLLRRTLGETIDVRYVETVGLWPAMADAAQLESAVLNLALNARDAMPGGGRLTIELGNKVLDDDYVRRHAETVPGDYAMVAVSDTGHGMTPDIVKRVFEPFFTTKPDGKGTGLGLAMVFGFVKQSGGHVKIYSEPGEGTTVKLYLPRAVGAAAATGQRSGSPVDLPRGSGTILVVEDEAAVREIACAILADLGYRVLEAGDGEEGLRVFAANVATIDLLLTDVILPGKVRGRELAERVQALRPEVRIVFMSGYTENSIIHHGRVDDGVHLISKPFKREQLARKVAEVLGPAGAEMPEAANVVALRPVKGTGL